MNSAYWVLLHWAMTMNVNHDDATDVLLDRGQASSPCGFRSRESTFSPRFYSDIVT